MKGKKITTLLATVLVTAGLVSTIPASAVSAAPAAGFGNPMGLSASDADQLQSQINAVLTKSPGAKQVSQYEITWDKGTVLESFPAPGQTNAPATSQAGIAANTKALRTGKTRRLQTRGTSDSCPWTIGGDHYYCFYQDSNFNGRRLQWSYQYCHSYNIHPYINFTDYGFNDQASSWVNNGGYTLSVYNNINLGSTLLWQEGHVANSPVVGAPSNDKASSFKAC